MKNSKVLFLPIILIFGALLISNYYFQDKDVDRDKLPKYSQRNPEVRAAYEYALSNPEILSNIPCYCGCYRLGHENVGNCFIKEVKEDGKVIFEEHGANCGMCYSIVLDSQELFEEGKSVQEIRNYIDNKYSSYGQGTDTPKI